MNIVSVTGMVDEQHSLSAQVPDSVAPGRVTVLIVPTVQQDDVDASWMTGIAHEWAADLGDTRQDIYTLADGEPVDAA